MARRMAAQAQGDLLVLERTSNEKGVLRQQIAVDDVRRTVSFFGSTAGEGGWRIAIVDAVDELNRCGRQRAAQGAGGAAAAGTVAAGVPFRGAGAADAALALPRVDVAAAGATDVARALAAAVGAAENDPQIAAAAAAADGSVGRAPWRFWTRTHWRCASARSKSSSDCRRSMPTLCMRSAMRLRAPTRGRSARLSIPSTLGCREASTIMAP